MNRAIVSAIAGPVLRARTADAFSMNEAVRVGERGLLGEVIQLKHPEIVVQVYEDTLGLRPGVRVTGSGGPLAVRLGPGLLGGIFDGLLRPLTTRQNDQHHFKPLVKPGQWLDAATPFGRVDSLRCFARPGLEGEVTSIVDEGRVGPDQTVCTLRSAAGSEHTLAVSHGWPVRSPRPVRERLPFDRPLITGQRVLDTLFPVARGGRAALPGGFGTGKTVLQQTLAKWSHADVVVYVGCGERGNEMAEVLEELPALEDPRSGRPLLERTVIIANTSNMPVAAREASIYTGVTVAEFFRDQGLDVALLADSTSRWAEALREISGRLGELPAEAGYPAYLSSRLADFYERAGRVQTLAGEEASLTLIGAISPPGGDFSEPVTKHTERYVRSVWKLDARRAHARLYPAIDPLGSYSEEAALLARWWEGSGSPRWSEHRRRLLELLEEQSRLERMARIIGKDALPERQQLLLLCAELANDGFLRQSALSPVDAYCSPARQGAMLELVLGWVDLSVHAHAAGVSIARIADLPVRRRLVRMGEEIGEQDLARFARLREELEQAFALLEKAA
jgi:V/A-type H+/Na+-transporting ATPase subunit A